MKKVLMKRYNSGNDSSNVNVKPSTERMTTRSMAKTASIKRVYTEEEKRNGIVICMGGPYSEVWYPPTD